MDNSWVTLNFGYEFNISDYHARLQEVQMIKKKRLSF